MALPGLYMKNKYKIIAAGVFFLLTQTSNSEQRESISVSEGKLCVELVYVRGGNFVMGCPSNPPSPWKLDDSALPSHDVFLNDFYVGKYPITVEEFCFFLNDAGFQEEFTADQLLFRDIARTGNSRFEPINGKARHAVSGVSHQGAKTFCFWLTKKANRKCRLPSEAEWEFVAKGEKDSAYPWGTNIQSANLLNKPVGTHPELVTPTGVHDLNGPVLQWCEDKFDSDFYRNSPKKNPICTVGDGRHVVRGGSMIRHGRYEHLLMPPTWRRSALRQIDSITLPVGFRIIVEKESSRKGVSP